jgi:hypothetical protein
MIVSRDNYKMSGGALRASGQDVTKSDLESSQEAFVAPKSLFDTLWAIVSWYGDRPFLGTRTRDANGVYGDYSYIVCWEKELCCYVFGSLVVRADVCRGMDPCVAIGCGAYQTRAGATR